MSRVARPSGVCALAAIAVLFASCERAVPVQPPPPPPPPPTPVAKTGLFTPESAVRQFVNRLADDDFDGAMQAFDLEDFVARVERTVKARLSDGKSDGKAEPGGAAPAKVKTLVRVAAINATAELAKATREFVYGLLLDEKQQTDLTEATDANIAAFIRDVDPRRLRAMQIVRIDPPAPSQMYSASGIALAKQAAARVGADEWTERIALFELGGIYHRGGFTLLRYGNAWRISQLQSLYGDTSLGQQPVPKTTPREYQELVQ